MEPIVIVRKRSHVWLIVIALIIAALFIAAAFWFMGDASTTDISLNPGSGIAQAAFSTS